MLPKDGLPIVVGIVTLALQAVALGCGSPEERTTAPQGDPARCLPIQFTQTKESLAITDSGGNQWTDIRVTINEMGSAGFEGRIPSIAPGATETLSFRDVVRSDGLRFDSEKYKILDVSVRTNEGVYCDPNANTKNLPKGGEVTAWQESQKGQWVNPDGSPKRNMYLKAQQAIMAERAKGK